MLRRSWMVACFLIAGVANAQTRHLTVHEALIVIADGTCNALPGVVAIVNDRDRFEYVLTERNGERVIDTGSFTFDATEAHASLHFPNMRTDCVKAAPDWDRRRAVFTFTRCNTKPVSAVTMRMEKEIDVSYVRTLRSRQPGTVPCDERSWFNTEGSVRAVRFADEELRLRLGSNHPDPKAVGDLRVREILNLVRDLKKGEFRPVGTDAMAYVLTVQRSKGDGSAPHLSPVSLDLAIKQMKEYGTLHLKVETPGLKK